MLIAGCTQKLPVEQSTHSIAFGSCLKQWQPQPVWQTIASIDPEAFIFTGDNVYTDKGPYTSLTEPSRIKQAYKDLEDTEDFSRFRQAMTQQKIQLYGTWDDHDYGINDGGANYPYQLASKEYFLDFFGLERSASGNAKIPGVYQSHFLNVNGLNVHIILLDTRSFRSDLKKSSDKKQCPPTGIVPELDSQATLLGEAQWNWLENELTKRADLRLLVSSIQVLPQDHCFEKWANFPHERNRLLALIRKTRAEHLILISGDRHLGEISRITDSIVGYPLYEVTASGLNSAMHQLTSIEANEYRLFNHNVRQDHFGLLSLKRQTSSMSLSLELRDIDGRKLQHTEIPLRELEFQTE